jgi:hypothetical protein
MHIYYHGNGDAILLRSAPWRAGSRKPLQQTRQLADKGGARQHETASGVTRRSYEVVLNVRDKTNDDALFCLQLRLEGTGGQEQIRRLRR